MKFSEPVATAIVIILVVAAAFLFAYRHMVKAEVMLMQRAVIGSIDIHAPRIATLLVAMRTNSPTEMADAAYAELQKFPSCSLISEIARSNITVTCTDEGTLECVIDTQNRFGINPRAIEQVTTNSPPGYVPHSEAMSGGFFERNVLDVGETLAIYAKLTDAHLVVDAAVRRFAEPVIFPTCYPAMTKSQAIRFLERHLQKAGVEIIHKGTNNILVRLAH